MTVVRTEWTGEILFHKYIFRAATLCSERAATEERGSFYFDLAAALLTACAIEGWANYVISAISPATYEQEKMFFGPKGDHSGIKGKIKWLAEQCSLVAHEVEGYNEVCELLALRDQLAHCKPQRYAMSEDHHVDDEPEMFPEKTRKLESLIHQLSERSAMTKVERFAQTVFAAVTSLPTLRPEERLRLVPGAFSGLMGFETVSTRAKQENLNTA